MRFIPVFILFSAVILITTSCSRTNDRLLQAEQLIETAPDSAMTILQKFNYNSLTDKEKALYGLLYVQVRDKKYLVLEPDSFLNYSLRYFEDKHNDHERLGACYLYKGRSLKYAQHYEKAVNYYLKALDVLNNSNNNTHLGKLNFDLGVIYNIQREYDLSRAKFWQSINCFKLSNDKQSEIYAIIYVGRTYHEQKEYNKALNLYKKYSHQITDSIEKAVLWQEISLNYYDSKQYDSAMYYLKSILYYPYVKNNRAFRFQMIADLYFDINKVDSAIFYSQNAFLYQPDIRIQKNCYRILTNSFSVKKNLDSINKYMSKYQDCNDSIRQIDSQTKGSYIETMHNTQKEVVKSHSWICYLLVFIFMVVVISIMLYVRKHRKGLQTIKTIEEKHLSQKKESVQDVVERTMEALHQSLKEKRNELKKKIKQNTPEGRREMILQLYDELVHFKNKQHFRNEMDNTLNNLYSKLETRYPKLKTKEIQWACLNMLDIPNDDSMQLLDYNTEAYKKMKQRFAQKVSVESVANIDLLLKNILYDAT